MEIEQLDSSITPSLRQYSHLSLLLVHAITYTLNQLTFRFFNYQLYLYFNTLL